MGTKILLAIEWVLVVPLRTFMTRVFRDVHDAIGVRWQHVTISAFIALAIADFLFVSWRMWPILMMANAMWGYFALKYSVIKISILRIIHGPGWERTPWATVAWVVASSQVVFEFLAVLFVDTSWGHGRVTRSMLFLIASSIAYDPAGENPDGSALARAAKTVRSFSRSQVRAPTA